MVATIIRIFTYYNKNFFYRLWIKIDNINLLLIVESYYAYMRGIEKNRFLTYISWINMFFFFSSLLLRYIYVCVHIYICIQTCLQAYNYNIIIINILPWTYIYIYSNKNNNNTIFAKYYSKDEIPRPKEKKRKNKLVPHYYSFLFLKFCL